SIAPLRRVPLTRRGIPSQRIGGEGSCPKRSWGERFLAAAPESCICGPRFVLFHTGSHFLPGLPQLISPQGQQSPVGVNPAPGEYLCQGQQFFQGLVGAL